MKLRRTVARALTKRKSRLLKNQANGKLNSVELNDDVTFEEISPFSPLNSENCGNGNEDQQSDDGSCKGESDSDFKPNVNKKKKSNGFKSKGNSRKFVSKCKSGNASISDEVSVDDPELELIIDDENIIRVKEVLEKLPKHFAKEYCRYLLFLQSKNPSNMRPVFVGKKEEAKYENCFICNDKCNGLSELKKHIKVEHEGPEGYNCTLCDKIFKNFRAFNDHFSSVHTRSRQCPYCDAMFFGQAAWRKHVDVAHPSDLKFMCTLCEKKFKTGSLLLAHINLHTGLTPHKCQYCPRSYSNLASLKEHQRHHLKEKYQFKCDNCNQTFVSTKLLNKHTITSHGTERRYKCKVCDKTYKSADCRYVHQLSHSERKYTCDTCGKSFPFMTKLKKHMLARMHGPLEKKDESNVNVNRESDATIYSAEAELDDAEISLNNQPLQLEKTILASFEIENDSDEEHDFINL